MFNKVNKYFFQNFLDSFISLFLTLFLIVSIVFFINIARVTMYIDVSFDELAKLYSYLLPQIILFTVPISFFVSLGISLFRLSKENESIVIFTLGKNPMHIAKFFLLLSACVSFILLVNALILSPYMKHLNEQFIEYKKTRFSINIRPGEFGQKFNDWYIFTSLKNETNEYENIVLYNPDLKQERLIISPTGKVQNNNGVLSLLLENGYFYDINENKWNISNYDKLIISSSAAAKILGKFDLLAYWKEAKTLSKRARELTIFTLIALFPLISTLFAFCFGLVVYRYNKMGPYIGIFAVLFAYFTSIMIFSQYPTIGIPLIFIVFFTASIFAFKTIILKKF